MPIQQRTSRRRFLKRSASAAIGVFGSVAIHQRCTGAADLDRSISVQSPSGVRQSDVLFDPSQYTAFPHVVKLEGNELLMAFRQAPSQERVRHTHPRSVITVIRSYDSGESWDTENAGQLAAGGGQEFAPIDLGHGQIGGLLAMHEVVPVKESQRASIPHRHTHEYPFANVGGFWCWSENSGLTWPLHHSVLFAPKLQTCSKPIRLASGTLLAPCYGAVEQGTTGVSSNVVYHSDDGGQTWSEPTVIAEGARTTRDFYEPGLVEADDGRIVALHRVGRCQDGRHGLFWQNESRDGGKTWTEPVETNITSGACPRLLKTVRRSDPPDLWSPVPTIRTLRAAEPRRGTHLEYYVLAAARGPRQ